MVFFNVKLLNRAVRRLMEEKCNLEHLISSYRLHKNDKGFQTHAENLWCLKAEDQIRKITVL